MRALVWLAILLAWCGCAFALDPSLDVNQYAHTAWKVRDGFTKGAIFSVAQTADGYLWLGTEFGLLRFDGVRAVPWRPPEGQHLPGSNISVLLAARDGTLWIGTWNGLASWNQGKLTDYPGLAGQIVATLLEDREGTVWVGTSGSVGKICSIKSGITKCHGEDGSLGRYVASLHEDSKGNLWAGTMNGLWRWKPGPPKLFPIRDAAPGISAIIEDATGLLVATRWGIIRFVDGKVEPYRLPHFGGHFRPTRLFRDSHGGGLWVGTYDWGILHVHEGRTDVFARPDGLSSDQITALFGDREGNIWVATFGGLDRFRDYTVPTLSGKQGLGNPTIFSVVAGPDGSVWLATLGGLHRWKDGQITIYRKSSARPAASESGAPGVVREITDRGLPDDSIQSLLSDHGRIWVSTNRGVAYFENGRFIPVMTEPFGIVLSMAGDANGNIWISDRNHGLFHLVQGNVVERIPWAKLGLKDGVYALVSDPLHGGLWAGFADGAVAYLKDGQVRASYRMGEGHVSQLQLDGDRTLWAATQGGLSRVKDGRVATLTSKNGLPCDTVHWMMEDDAHSVWLYMACGLVRIARSELDAWISDPKRKIQTTVFDSSDGVTTHANAGGYHPQVAKATDGRLWFLPWDGVSVIDPRHLAFNKLPPPVHIEQVIADGKTYDVSNGLRLPPRVRDLTIDYTALSFVAPEKVLFRVKLEGWDKDWRDLGNGRRVHFTNLPPRHYRFRVIACNNSGVWNDTGASLDFAIAPAYWQTKWFRALCVAALLALLWGLYRLRVRQLRRQERKLRDVVETIPAIAWTALPDGWVDFSNHHWEEYTGLSLEKGAGSGWEAAVHPNDVKRHAEKWRASVASGELFESEARYRRADGEYRWFLVRAVPLRDTRGKIVKWYGTKTDIEDRKQAEQDRERLRTDLAHMNRVSIMGELSASLSHELKQPIAAAITSANTALRWLQRDQPNVERACETTARIIKDGTRAADIIDRLRSLYKKSPPKRELVDVNEIVRELVSLLRGEANLHAVSVRTDLAADLPKITADRVQIQQVLMNLMLNGIEAMKETGGILTVKSQSGQDGRVLIVVSDTGVGLAADQADQIFNAFFTTKPQGSGMGLAISRSIVESHGGRLWATSNNGRGATFQFTLPTAAEAVKVPTEVT